MTALHPFAPVSMMDSRMGGTPFEDHLIQTIKNERSSLNSTVKLSTLVSEAKYG